MSLERPETRPHTRLRLLRGIVDHLAIARLHQHYLLLLRSHLCDHKSDLMYVDNESRSSLVGSHSGSAVESHTYNCKRAMQHLLQVTKRLLLHLCYRLVYSTKLVITVGTSIVPNRRLDEPVLLHL